MKILIVTDSMNIGGAETHVFTLINELKNKHNVTLVSSGGIYVKALEKNGLKCVFAPLNKRDALSIRKSREILNKEMKRADIVHTHTRFSSFLAKKIRGNSNFPKIVTTAHLNFPLFPFGAFAFWGDATLAVSEDIRMYLRKHYKLNEENIKLTKNAIDLTLYRKSSLERKLIIHTSRIDKGRARTAFLLVEAAETILKEYKDWRIMIVGDGNLFDKLKKRANAINNRLGFEGIILTGARGDIPALLTYGSIFIGVSRSALEGMSAGLPTIICGDQGYGGIVKNENFSVLSYSNFCARGLSLPNINSLSNDIKTLISDAVLRNNLGEYARKSMEVSYKSRVMANDALDCYNRVFTPPSVCLMGFFGYHNLGDEETLSSAVKALKSIGINDISVLTASSDKYTSGFHSIKKYDRMKPGEIIKAIRKNDIFVLCGGNLIQNETSMRSLIYYEQTIRYAKRAGKRIYLMSSGFGEIRGAFAQFLFNRSLKSCDFCGCRTYSDLKKSELYNENSILMPDFCFLLPEKTSVNKNGTFIWIMSDKQSIEIEDIIEISRCRNIRPVAVSLFKSNDKESITTAKRFGIDVATPKNFDDLSDILISAEFSISERLHGSIFSIISHVPTYITTNREKNIALLKEVNSRTLKNDIILPYYKSYVLEKKEIGACDSDFNYVIESLKQDINHALNEIF